MPSYTEREALKKLVDEGAKIGDADIMVPVDIQGQYINLTALIAPMMNAETKYFAKYDLSFDDAGSTTDVLTVPEGYFMVVWKIWVSTDSNLGHLHVEVDGNNIEQSISGAHTMEYVTSSTYPFGIPCRNKVSVYGKATSGNTTTVQIRIYYWLVPTSPT